MKKKLSLMILVFVVVSASSQTIEFSGGLVKNRVQLSWSIDSNETADKFEIEKSFDGINFFTAALVFTSEKKGAEKYQYREANRMRKDVFYRVKIYGYLNKYSYSKPLRFSMVKEKKNNN